MSALGAVIFSGHNQRAVTALCRAFAQEGISFSLVASSNEDPVYLTSYADRVLFKRKDRDLSIALFAEIARLHDVPFTLCPTSEYLNAFLLENREPLEKLGCDIGLPSKFAYDQITNKDQSRLLFHNASGVKIPLDIDPLEMQIPCILKPKMNVAHGDVLYPIVYRSSEQDREISSAIASGNYFVQEFISGRSYYLCGYLDRKGGVSSYWQENLMQQPGGKSIVLARSCANPGVPETPIFAVLKSINYRGPFMIELIERDGDFYYIETNPRFWGPLQLGLDCSDLLTRYIEDIFHPDPGHLKQTSAWREGLFYAWAHGASSGEMVSFPGLDALPAARALLKEYDVYNRPDTTRLHQVH